MKVVLAANVYLPRKGHRQDALFAGNKVELRGVKKVIRSFRAVTKAEESAFRFLVAQPLLAVRLSVGNFAGRRKALMSL